jgi:hypothetical protein
MGLGSAKNAAQPGDAWTFNYSENKAEQKIKSRPT